MIAVIQFKKHVASILILRIVVCKFSNKQKSCPIVLFPVDENTKINLHYAVFPLGLTICLQIECNGELLFNFEKVA